MRSLWRNGLYISQFDFFTLLLENGPIAISGKRKMFDMTLGACLDEKDPDVFFSNENNVYEPKKLRYAKFVCMGCPIKMECRDEGDRLDAVGVWGGLTEKERRRASSTPSAVVRDKKVMEAFRVSNAERSRLAAELDMHLYKEALGTRGENLPVDVYKLLEARISNPNLSLSQLGKVVGMSKDAASGKLRRVKNAMVSGKDLV